MNRRVFDPGQLRHRLTLQSLTETQDAAGAADLTWTDVADVWAHLRPVSGTSAVIAQQADESLTHEIAIRFRDDVASGWRFVTGERTFRIVTVYDPDERQCYLICSTTEEGR